MKNNIKIENNIVNSHNEWDPLEEVVVGRIDNAEVPQWHVSLEGTIPKDSWNFFKKNGGKKFSKDLVNGAQRDLDGLVKLLQKEGVKVRRPDRVDFTKNFCTPEWSSSGGLYAAMPRDILLIIGNEIIESPMAWRSRYFEIHAYRSLLKEYFHKGGQWSSCPKAQMNDSLYNASYKEPKKGKKMEYVITEFEPVFDAADFIRFGKDIFVQLSNVTNKFGIEWVSRHVGKKYNFHILKTNDTHPMHIDATIIPLAPGKVLINPERIKKLPEMFKSWEILKAPPPCGPLKPSLYFSSRWLSMNILSLDKKRIVVEKHETLLIESLKKWGFEPIPCEFRHFHSFGGSLHCATSDIRRKGKLQSYF